MRILSVSDLHYRLPHYDWLVRASEDPATDVVVLAGDLADVVSPVPIDVQAVVLESYLYRLADHSVVLASSGNHDLDGPGANGEQVAGWMRRVEAERGALVLDAERLARELRARNQEASVPTDTGPLRPPVSEVIPAVALLQQQVPAVQQIPPIIEQVSGLGRPARDEDDLPPPPRS